MVLMRRFSKVTLLPGVGMHVMSCRSFVYPRKGRTNAQNVFAKVRDTEAVQSCANISLLAASQILPEVPWREKVRAGRIPSTKKVAASRTTTICRVFVDRRWRRLPV